MARLTLQVGTIETQQSAPALEQLEQRIARDVEAIVTDLQIGSASDAEIAALQAQVALLVEGVTTGLASQRGALAQAARYGDEQARILGLTSSIQLALETLDPELVGSRLDRAEIQDAQRAVASWQVDLLNLARLQETAAIEAVRLSLIQSLRSTVRALSQAQVLLARPDLSAQLLDLLNSATQNDGLLSMRAALLAENARVHSAIASVDRQGVQVSALLDSLVARRNDNAAQASVELQRVLKNSERALYAASALALLLSVLFVRLLVFRQVVQPLAGLTDRTTALASGDIRSPVPVQRYAELTQIASSLRVFQDKLQQLIDTEDQLREQNLRLNVANEELNRFTYAASHDLRSPLRGARTLAGFINEDLEGEASTAVREHLRRLDERLEKMETLLEDLLAYSQAGSESETPERVKLAPLVRDALSLVVDDTPPELRFELHQPEVLLPPVAFKQAIRNLLDNAIKHASPDASAGQVLQLVLRSYLEDGLLVIELEDNGPGIPEAYRDRMLELFQSLESNVSNNASGIGLAMVQRLLARYDGVLALLAATSGQGTLARITLPDEDAPVSSQPRRT